MTNQVKTDNLNYLIDPPFSKINRLSKKSWHLTCRTSKENTIFAKTYIEKYGRQFETFMKFSNSSKKFANSLTKFLNF